MEIEANFQDWRGQTVTTRAAVTGGCVCRGRGGGASGEKQPRPTSPGCREKKVDEAGCLSEPRRGGPGPSLVIGLQNLEDVLVTND